MKMILGKVFLIAFALAIVFGISPEVYAAELNYRNLSMTPGRTVNEMRFTWHSTSSEGSVQYRVWGASAWITVNSTSRTHHTGVPGNFRVHQPIITGLTPNTTYEYRITWTGGQSDIKTFRTGGANEFSFFAVSDPQMSNSSAEATGWANTLAVASTVFPEARFIMSIGDQVASGENWTHERAQLNFNRLFAPSEFHRLPLAPIVGNHDGVTTAGNGVNVNPDLWHFHYNTPHSASNVRHFTLSGRPNPPTQFDYYFRYGNVLFFMLAVYDSDTTGGSSASRAEITARSNWMAGIINANQNADWRVVAFHQPPYSASRPDTEGSKTRILQYWIPVFEQHNIDIAFTGHDHIYSRTHHMQGFGPGGTPGTPRLTQNWASQANNAVISPTAGITYIAFGSPSGHGLRQPEHMPRNYLARYHQANLREFSVVNVTPHTFSVETYMINGTGIDGNSITMTDIYTIVKANRPPDTHIPEFCQNPRPVIPVECDYCGQLVCVCVPAIYDMQRDPNWTNILSSTAHTIMRGTNNAGTSTRIDTPSRELRFTGRTGTSQGIVIRASALLSALSHEESRIQIQYSGRLNGTGTSQIRIEQDTTPVYVWTEPTGAGNAFSHTITLTREHLLHATTIGTGIITLGASPNNAELVITDIRITEIFPDAITFYNMQTDLNWSNIQHLTNHPIMRGVGISQGGVVTSVDTPTRELRMTGRGGTSQGLRIRAGVLLNALSGEESRMRIEYSGRLNVAGNSQIRIEQSPTPDWIPGVNIWTEPTGAGNVFSHTVTLTHEHLQRATTIGTGDITLGAFPGNAELAITGIRITEILTNEPDQWTVEFKLADGTQTCDVDL
ncbi:MAG: metallophosphoesterase family protein, partial [Defluviitaleaceae bacterium]|nr:metallophosphoesterase family protein [Defluviitaleaceae bacterium]